MNGVAIVRRGRVLATFALTCLVGQCLTGALLYLARGGDFAESVLLAHVLLGLGGLVALVAYLVRHVVEMWHRDPGPPRRVAVVATIAVTGSLTTGTILTVVYALDFYGVVWLEPLHRWCSAAVVMALPVHVATVTQGRRSTTRTVRPAVVGLASVALCALVVFAVGRAGAWDAALLEPTRVAPPATEEEGPFFPSLTRTDHGGFFEARLLTGDAACGACHAEIYAESMDGVHHFTGVDNLIVATGARPAERAVGVRASRFCASCHEPAALLSGVVTESLFTTPAEVREQGTTCLVCHGIERVDGHGGKVVAPPDPFAFFNTGSAFLDGVNRVLVRAFVEEHRAQMAPALLDEPMQCSGCHNVNANAGFNGFGFLTLHNEFDEWSLSPFAARSGPDGTQVRCQDCHMFQVYGSSDPVARRNGGTHRSHRFLAANTLVAKLYASDEQFRLTEAYLKGELERTELLERVPLGPVVELSIQAPDVVAPGSTLVADVLVHNRAVGHTFPAGAIEVHDTWIELTVRDADDRLVFASGALEEDGWRGPEAYTLVAHPIDAEGNDIPATGGLATGFRYRNSILNGDAVRASYEIPLPGGYEGELTLAARLRYRRVDEDFSRLMWSDDPPAIPITDVSTARATIRTAAAAQSGTQ